MRNKKEKDYDEMLSELARIARADTDAVVTAIRAGEVPPDLAAVSAVKCKRSSDGACEWEVKTVDRLKAIELYLKYAVDRGGESPPAEGLLVDYDYG